MEVHSDATLAGRRSREVETSDVVTEVICTKVTTETTEHREGTETREWQARDPRSRCASEQTGQRPEEGEATEEVAPSRPGLASKAGGAETCPSTVASAHLLGWGVEVQLRVHPSAWPCDPLHHV